MTGTIKKIVSDRGFGFIHSAGTSEDVFFHVSNLPTDISIEDLKEGQQLTFDIQPTDKGPQAINIILE